ncbi:NAD(P)H-dependent oxidoreductase [Candidatus Woesebacteria bacterium]|nr:MAG: NAD(P)H-dependent oxidoreductase [Candidatus Woesebacteria bacterium]
MKKLQVAVVLGTNRMGNQSTRVAQLIKRVGDEFGEISTKYFDAGSYNIPHDGDTESVKIAEYSQLTKESDAFIFVVPEYNHSFPGSFKTLFDTEYQNYLHKPATLAGVSNGPWGGTRAVEALIAPLRTTGLIISKKDLYFPDVINMFDESGDLKEESSIRRIHEAYKELIWLARTLAWGRQHS